MRVLLIECPQLVVEVLPPATMPYPPPLDEGLREEVYLKHIAPAPPTPSLEPHIQEEEEQETEKIPIINEDQGQRKKWVDPKRGGGVKKGHVPIFPIIIKIYHALSCVPIIGQCVPSIG